MLPQQVSISTRDLALTNENSRWVRPEIDDAFPFDAKEELFDALYHSLDLRICHAVKASN